MTLRLRTEDLEWREIDTEIVILDGRGADYLTLNGSGAVLWRKLAGNATRDQLVDALLDAFEVDHSTAAADTDVFLAALARQGLLAS